MTRVLVAPDSLKGSLSAAAVAAAIATGVHRADPTAEVIERPMADGGEGTMAILLEVWGGEPVVVATVDPRGRPMEAAYGRVGTSGGMAVVEFAAAGGLPLVDDAPDPLAADSWGTGMLLRHALEHGVGELVVCLGGSASTDGGAGILRALGARLLDATGAELAPGGGALINLDRVELDGLLDIARRARWTLACDVTNPLLGRTGAAAAFGPQKGATPHQVDRLDEGLGRLAEALAAAGCSRVHHVPGAGAAGGAAGGLAAVFAADPAPGADLVADAVGLDEALAGVDLVITAEGRIDEQSAAGKVVGTVARRAQRAGVPAIGLAGAVAGDLAELHTLGLAAAFSFADRPLSLAQSTAQAAELLEKAAEQVIRLFQASSARMLPDS